MGAGAIHGHQEPDQQSTSPSSSPYHSNTISNSSRLQDCSNSSSSTPKSTGTNHNISNNTMKMSCETCSCNFTLFKRKKFCRECHRYFCSTCLPKPPSSAPAGRQCQKCLLLISGHFTRDDLQNWKIKDIRCFLDVRKVSTKGCREKHDLVELVLSQFCKERRNSLERQAEHDLLVQQMAAHLTLDNARNIATPSAQEGNDEASGVTSDTAEPSASSNPTNEGQSGRDDRQDHPDVTRFNTMNSQEFRNFLQSQVEEILNSELAQREAELTRQNTPSPKVLKRFHLEEIKTLEDVELLSVRQLKVLLVNNFVDFKGCCEKPELIQRVKRLWTDHQENRIKADRIHKADEDAAVASTTHQDEFENVSANVSTPPVATDATRDSSHCDTPEVHPSPFTMAPSATALSNTSPSSSPSKNISAATEEPVDSLCRVCMDSLTNCILLECGHMVTCTTCGKQLAECPICRQYISRVVRVFRS